MKNVKNVSKTVGVIVLAAIIGFSMIACGSDDGGGPIGGLPGATVLEGTWSASGGRVATFTGNTFVYKVNGVTTYSGTFALSGTTITFTTAQGPASGNFSVSGDTLTLSNHSWDPSVNGAYTKDESVGTEGLAYELINGGTAYRVRKGTVTSGAVVIPAIYNELPVTEIGSSNDDLSTNGAFYNTGITSITIPASVTFIGYFAFYNCTNLASVTIPSGVMSLDASRFYNCSSLISITVDTNNPSYSSEGGILYNKIQTSLIAYPSASGSVTIPPSVTAIGTNAFYNNTGITSITIPASVMSVGDYAFYNCTNLTSVTFAVGSNISSASFGNMVFPEGTGTGGNTLKTAYQTGGAGTYTRASGGSTWTKGGGGTTVIEGTWDAGDGRVATFTGNTFTYKVNGTVTYSGTFSLSGSTITFSTSQGPASGNFEVSGDTLILSNHSWDSSVNGRYTKDEGGGGTDPDDGITWTPVTNPFGSSQSTIRAIAYGGSKFVAGGTGKMAYSTNGTDWNTTVTFTPSNESVQVRDIAYGGGKFVAVGDSGKMAASTDGINWTVQTLSAFSDGNKIIYAIAFGNNMFVAGSGNGGSNGKLATSTDGGLTWNDVVNNPLGTNDIYTIAYGNGMFVTGGSGGRMMNSSNGTAWNAVTDSTFGVLAISGIAYGDGKFVAVGRSGRTAYSSNGETWTTGTISSFGASNINAIVYDNGKFVAVGAAGKAAHSSDGINWEGVTDTTFDTTAILAIAYGNGKFIAAGGPGGDNGKMAYWADGGSGGGGGGNAGTYIITGTAPTFTATNNSVTVGTANQAIQTVINAIKNDAGGNDCTIQFGNGTVTLDIGSADISFSNSPNTWGVITLSGKVTSTNYSIGISSSVSVISTADITNTYADSGTSGRVLQVQGGTLTVNSGTLLSKSHNAILVSSTYGGTVTINGGTVETEATGRPALQNNSNGNVVITGGTISAIETAIDNHDTGNITISSGTISAGIYTVRTQGTGEIVITGGIFSSSALNGTIIDIGSETKTVTISDGTFTATGGTTINNMATLLISGGTFSNTGQYGTVLTNGYTGTITINGGTITATGTNAKAVDNIGGTVTINGGTISATAANAYAVDNGVTGQGTVTVGAGATINGNTRGY